MEAMPKVLQTRWLELSAWPAGQTDPLTDPVAVLGYAVSGTAEDLQATLVVREPLERLILAVRPAFLPALQLSQGPTGPWEEAVAWGACEAGAQRVFWARRQEGGRWKVAPAVPRAEEADAPDRYAAWFTDELPAGTP